MLPRWFSGIALVSVMAAAPARAADEKPQPAVVVGVRSLDALLSNARYLASLAGEGERAKQAEKIVKGRIGAKGLEGIDAKRPFGFYAVFGSELSETAS